MPTKIGNLMIGNVVFLLFGFIGCVAISIYVRQNTEDKNMIDTNGL